MVDKVSLVRLKQWVIPQDEASYAVLRRHGITHTRINQEVFATLVSLRLSPAGVRGRFTPFDEIWREFLTKVATRWRKIPSTKFTNNAKEVRLESTHRAVFDQAQAAAEKVHDVFERFFIRWGSFFEITSSSHNGCVRIVITFQHGFRAPVIATSTEAAIQEEPLYLDFDGTRIEITRDTSGMSGARHLRRVNVQVKCGLEYKTIHTSRYLDSQFKLNKEALAYMIGGGELPRVTSVPVLVKVEPNTSDKETPD